MKFKNVLLTIAVLMIALTLSVSCKKDQPPAENPPAQEQGENAAAAAPFGTATLIADSGTPFAKYGRLQVLNGQLCDNAGEPVQLKGMSSFGLQWDDGSWILTDEAFNALAADWKCDIIRFAMYVTENGYATEPSTILARLEQGIELASERGMYVMIDWHILSPGDPTAPQYLEAGLNDTSMPAEFLALKNENPTWNGPQVFFAYIAQKYGDYGNVLYEPANEPNRLGSYDDRHAVWQNQLKPYHESIIEVIRAYDNDGIVICGTDNWSQYVDAPTKSPLTDPQTMYTMHFYAGTHDAGYDKNPDNPDIEGSYWLRKMTDDAIAAGLPIFCTEWGISEATGDGGPYVDFAERWINYMGGKNISWTAWSMAQKNEISAAFISTTPANPSPSGWEFDDMSVAGRFYRAMIRGEAAPMYYEYELAIDFEGESAPEFIADGDSPNKDMVFSLVDVNGNQMAKIENVTFRSGVWNNRAKLEDIDVLFGIYQDIEFDVYLDADKVIGQAADKDVFAVWPIFQYPPTWFVQSMTEITLKAGDFEAVDGTDLVKTTIKASMKPLGAAANQVANHLIFLVSLTDVTQGSAIYIDNIAFSTNFNGDVSNLPELPDDPGEFIKLPFDFESETREGWAKDGDSKIKNTDLAIGTAETFALRFPLSLSVGANEWEDGVRLSSSMDLANALTTDEFKKVTGVSIDVYLQPDKANTGELQLIVCPIPNGAGYWHQTEPVVINPNAGFELISSGDEGMPLQKYSVTVPFTIAEYSEPDVHIRNIIVVLLGSDCDYIGDVFYDNVGFVVE